jgi:DNA-binding transcriptional MerR regulator
MFLTCFAAHEIVLAQGFGSGQNHQTPGHAVRQHMLSGIWDQLTDEQQEQLLETIKELRTDNATRQEIHKKVGELLQSWGIELPENWDQRPQRRRPGFPFMNQLTEEQRQEIKDKIKTLYENGASREEIHQTIVEMLQGYGIELPEDWDQRPQRRRTGFAFMNQLTEEQRQEIKDKIKTLHENGSSREEIHKTIGQMLQSYGIELPENWGQTPRHRRPHFRFMHKLSKEQRLEIRETIKTLHQNGASRLEIRKAVHDLLMEFGIEPTPYKRGQNNLNPGMGSEMIAIWNEFTEEQKQLVRDTVKSLRQQGTTRQEIRKAIRELIQEFKLENTNNVDESQEFAASNYPNPFNPSTTITYTLDEPGMIKLDIYNVQGQLIRSLVDGYQIEGTHQVQWDGRMEDGSMAATGTYIYKIKTKDQTISRQMTLMK